MKHLILFFLFFSCDSIKNREKDTLKQEEDTLKFVEYKDFESAFKSDQNLKRLNENFNLFSVLLLDSTMSKTFFEYNSERAVTLHDCWVRGRLSKLTVGFVTESKTLKEVLLSKTSREKILNCVNSEESLKIDKFTILSPVYIKENTGITVISNQASYDTYKITLLDGVVQINWLFGSIE